MTEQKDNSKSALFQPVRIGNVQLQHRVAMAPLTRYRATEAHVPTDLMADYYAQRASVPGTLLITEATFIAAQAGGYENVPGIWSQEQVQGWKKVVDAVHARGSYIFMQLWQLGRAALPDVLAKPDSPANPGGPYPYVSASDVRLSTRPPTDPAPRALTDAEVREYIQLFGKAAANAVHGAGFDGVEVHGAHGYLVDQFTQDITNKRDDEWGGSIENRSKFALEVLKEIVRVVGEERTAIRLSPFSTFQDMRMDDPFPQFTYLVRSIRTSYPRFAFLHVVEPRAAGNQDRKPLPGESNDFLRAIWKEGQDATTSVSQFLSAGGHTAQTALEDADTKGGLVVFGRYFISNPDLPVRIKKSIAFTPYDRDTFYKKESPIGYIDYTFADKEAEENYQNPPKVSKDSTGVKSSGTGLTGRLKRLSRFLNMSG